MVLSLAWRNTWRNTTRSLVVIIAIALGIWAAMFMSGFATGMSRSYINNAIDNILAHIQVHEPSFISDGSVQYYIPQLAALESQVAERPELQHMSVRTVVNGMIASGQASRGVVIKGVEPEPEAQLSGLADNVVEGEYFQPDRKNQLLLGKKMAGKLKAKLRSKLVLTFQDLDGTITAGAFRVVGIYESGNAPFDEANVFVKRADLNRLLIPNEHPSHPEWNIESIAHEVAIMFEQADQIEAVEAALEASFPTLQVDTYREISPDLQLYESQIHNISLIYLVIIMLALVFGIINTMLMAVLERIRELGMLMAIGMNKGRVFFMIVCETLILSFIGAPIGIFLGWLTTWYLGNWGIDLSAFSDTMQMYGMSEQIFFELEPIVYLQVPVVMILTALLAAIYPAYKAIRLRPVQAIRKI